MFQMFHLSSFCMLQVLHLDVFKVDQVSVVDLHLVGDVDQIFGGVSQLHVGYRRWADHAL